MNSKYSDAQIRRPDIQKHPVESRDCAAKNKARGRKENLMMRCWDTVILISYFVSMTVLGTWFSKRNKSTEAYFMGNRAFPGWAIGLSMLGTSISSVSFLALPGDTFKTTWMRAIVYWTFPIATIVAVTFILPFFRRGKVTTAYEFLEKRWSSGIRIYASSMYYPVHLLRCATILYLLAQLMYSILGWPMLFCVTTCGLIVALYTISGGIEAVVWTDVVQTIILVMGGTFILITIADKVPGGLSEIIKTGVADHKLTYGYMGADGTVHAPAWGFNFSQKTLSLICLTSLLNWIAAFCSDQNYIQRYCASKSQKEAKKALWFNCWIGIATWTFFCFTGTALYVFFKHFPTTKAMEILKGLGGSKAEEIVPYYVINYLPDGMSGLVVAACIAAAMSSISSSINSISTVFVTDLYRRYIKKDRGDNHYLRIARYAAAAASLIMIAGASLLVVVPTQTLQDTSFQLYAFIAGNGIPLIFLLGLLTKITNTRALVAGILTIYIFKIWALLGTTGFIPEQLRISIDNYYISAVVELAGLAVVLITNFFLPKKTKDLTGYTLWT